MSLSCRLDEYTVNVTSADPENNNNKVTSLHWVYKISIHTPKRPVAWLYLQCKDNETLRPHYCYQESCSVVRQQAVDCEIAFLRREPFCNFSVRFGDLISHSRQTGVFTWTQGRAGSCTKTAASVIACEIVLKCVGGRVRKRRSCLAKCPARGPHINRSKCRDINITQSLPRMCLCEKRLSVTVLS